MDVAAAVQKLATSSAYRYGDALCFRVPVTKEHSLPGRHEPMKFCLDFPSPGRAAVICPGNGGLATQLFLQGATEVVLIEPRARFHEPLKAVLKLFIEVNPGKQVQVFTELPSTAEHIKKAGLFDSILWSEGVDEIGDPAVIHTVVQMLKPSGRMKIELPHGTSIHTAGKINNWRPTVDCWQDYVGKVAKLSEGKPGRLGTTKTYIISSKMETTAKFVEPATSPPVVSKPVVQPRVETKPEPKVEKPQEAFPRPELPKPALKLNAAAPTASVGSDDIVDLKSKPGRPSLKKP